MSEHLPDVPMFELFVTFAGCALALIFLLWVSTHNDEV